MPKIQVSNDMIPDFQLLAPSVWELTTASVCGPTYFPPKATDAPSLILLCTWTGAQNRYIAKYTTEYQSRLPSTRIMVITTTAKDLCFRNSRSKQERLKPAVERILSYKYLDYEGMDRGILMHVFSEGGSNKACELAEAYYNMTATRLPVSALCFDSTPGHPRYLRLCNALNKPLPQVPVLRHTGLFFGSAVLGAIWITYNLVEGYENNVVTRTRRRINDAIHFDLSAPRCYLFSKNDALIAWQDVYEHAEESMHKGMHIKKVIFEDSGHVEHAKKEPERYWDAVMAIWRDARNLPKFDVVVEEVSVQIIRPERSKTNESWTDADSECTLPGPGLI